MMHLLRVVTKFSFIMASLPSLAFAADSCIEPDQLAPEISLSLKHAEKKGDAFIGEFELINNGFNPKIVLAGHGKPGRFYIDYPAASIEFQDLNRTWRTLENHAPGTFLKPPDVLSIALHAKVVFKVELFSTSWGELSGYDFRLVLKLTDEPHCIISEPFRAFPVRSPISHIEAVTKPKPRAK